MKEEQMTNEKLNEICSEFAGLSAGHKPCRVPGGCDKYDCDGFTDEPEWLPVSSDWAAAGRLMEALRATGRMKGSIDFDEQGFQGTAYDLLGPDSWFQEQADSGPRALALAVAALAEASGKEAGR